MLDDLFRCSFFLVNIQILLEKPVNFGMGSPFYILTVVYLKK